MRSYGSSVVNFNGTTERVRIEYYDIIVDQGRSNYYACMYNVIVYYHVVYIV